MGICGKVPSYTSANSGAYIDVGHYYFELENSPYALKWDGRL